MSGSLALNSAGFEVTKKEKEQNMRAIIQKGIDRLYNANTTTADDNKQVGTKMVVAGRTSHYPPSTNVRPWGCAKDFGGVLIACLYLS